MRLEFMTKHFLSGSCAPAAGPLEGYYDADSVFVLRRSSRVVSAVGRSSPRRKGEGDGDEWCGQVSAHGEGSGRTHREGERDEKEASKVRRGFNKVNNHCDWVWMSVETGL